MATKGRASSGRASSGRASSGRVTRRTVAERAGVAETTVSFVLNGRGDDYRIAAATQQRVRDAARDLNYLPSAAARALASRRSRIIGLAMSATQAGLRAPVVADVMLAAVEQARAMGHFVLQLPEPTGTPDEVFGSIRDAGIAGLVASTGGSTARLGEHLARAGLPVVWVEPNDRGLARDDGPVIGADPIPGVTQLAGHLRARGCRTIAVLTPRSSDSQQPSRRVAPLDAQFGANASTVHIAEWTVAAGRQAMATLLATGERPDAVFGANDLIACGAIQACHAAGFDVPGDIAVAGYGDFGEASVIEPGLTTVSWPLDQLGRTAVRTLISALTGHTDDRADHIKLPTSLIVRGSA